jgi:hypothetical protein
LNRWRHAEAGSSLVAATSLGILLSIIGLTLAARVAGGSIATAGALHRERSLVAAESMLAQTLERFGRDPDAWRFLRGELGPSALDRTWSPIAQSHDSILPSAEGRVELVRTGAGEVRIRAAGRSGAETRSLEAIARARSVADYGWLIDLEVLDPLLTTTSRGPCRVHGGVPRLPAEHDCRVTHYDVQDRFDGPFHSNDVVTLTGAPTFLSSVTTSWVTRQGAGLVEPGFIGPAVAGLETPFGLGVRSFIELPDDASAVVGPLATCRFRGPTVVRFLGSSIRVRSPLSARGGTVETGPVGCPGVDVVLLEDFVEIALPPAAVIEVARARAEDCGNHPLGIGPNDDRDLERTCFAGDAFVWGEYTSRRTLIAHDDVVLVRDVVRSSGAAPDAVLGLIAGDSVVFRRPVGAPLRVVAPFGTNLAFGGSGTIPFGPWPSDAPLQQSAVWDSPRIDGALVALRGSVRIENPAWGREHEGAVTIHGSLTQRFRGVFAWERLTASGALQARMGYPLELTYDRRFLEHLPRAMPGLGDPTLRVLRITDLGPADG